MGIKLWHNRRDTLAAIQHQEVGYVSLRLPIGVWPPQLGRHNIILEYTIDPPANFQDHLKVDRPNSGLDYGVARIGLNKDNKRGAIKRITADTIAASRENSPDQPDKIRPYYDLDWIFRTYRSAPTYYEATLEHVPVGSIVHYQIKVYFHNARPTSDPHGKYHVYAGPTFGLEDVKWCKSHPTQEETNTVVYWKPSSDGTGYDLRFDFMRSDQLWNKFRLELKNTGAPDRVGTLEYGRMPMREDRLPPDAFWPPTTPVTRTWPWKFLPIVNAQFDTVTVTLTKEELTEGTRICWSSEEIGQVAGGDIIPVQTGPFHPIRLMFIHYANQSVNDLFETPNKNYTPARTYMQTTLRDEDGTYCSRPDATAQGLPAGYMFALNAHKQTELPCVVAISGGCLSLIAQDRAYEYPRGTPVDDIATITQYIHDGLVEPAIGGLAGHRMLYFQAKTNAFALQTGITLLENILGGTAPVVYPNSRVYAATPNIDDAILGARISKPLKRSTEAGSRRFVASTDVNPKVRYVVVDQQGFSKDNIKGSRPEPIWQGREHAYLWQQQCKSHRGRAQACEPSCPTWYWLFIDFDTKDHMLQNNPPNGDGNEAWQAGKLSLDMRKELIYGFAEQDRTRRGLLVYSDDIEKFAGNGWFDGDYNGTEIDWIGIATAALEWIAAHPWISVVTTADLDPRTDCVGTVFVEGAIDPSIHQDDPTVPEESWARPYSTDSYRRATRLDFDTWSRDQVARKNGFLYGWWYRVWRDSRSAWLDKSLAEISEALEDAIMMRQPTPSNPLHTLAQLAYTLAQHEPHWNKQPLEPYVPKSIYDDPHNAHNRSAVFAYQRPAGEGVVDPEDFVWCASLQVRNAWVFRCAAEWPGVLSALSDGKPHCNEGPLIEAVDCIRQESCPTLAQQNVRPGLQWDLDVTENVILYNDKLLVVMDANGGRITHVFAMHDGTPVVVSGNLKAYQFLGDERIYRGQLPCDGAVLQNTVFVPNHRYIASDIEQSQSTLGEKFSRKPHIVTRDGLRVEDRPFGAEDWLYPDNFNCYELASKDTHPVVWSYPGKRWDLCKAKPLNLGKFTHLLSAYRACVLELPNRDPFIEARLRSTEPRFSKTITLDGDRIRVAYAGTKKGHRVANEFSLDHLSMLMSGATQTVEIGERQITVLRSDLSSQLRTTITLLKDCAFTAATVRGKRDVPAAPGEREDPGPDRRLHRAFSDCIEIESTADGEFVYEIAVG